MGPSLNPFLGTSDDMGELCWAFGEALWEVERHGREVDRDGLDVREGWVEFFL